MKQSCDDLFYTIVMNIKVKRILEEEEKNGMGLIVVVYYC